MALCLSLATGLLASAADVRVAAERPSVAADLTTAWQAAATVPTLLIPTPPPVPAAPSAVRRASAPSPLGAAPASAPATGRVSTAAPPLPIAELRGALGVLARRGGAAGRAVSGVRWAVSERVGSDPGGVAGVRRDGERVGRLARAAGELDGALGPLVDGDADPAALDDLARGISRYTSAAVRVQGPGREQLERASLAAGLLTALSGADRPRTWRFCTPSRCTVLRLAGGKVTRRREGDPSSSPSDLRVSVRDAVASEDMLFGTPEPGAPQRFDPRAVYRLLLTEPGAVTSADPQEEAALAQLGR